jgi:hypothetical protein
MLVLSEAYLHPQTVKTDRWLIDADGNSTNGSRIWLCPPIRLKGGQPDLGIKIINFNRASQVRNSVSRIPRPPQN